MLHPELNPRESYVEKLLRDEDGPFIAVSDYMKIVPDQIAPWVPGGLMTLGTDGFGRSDTRERLRRFFEVDAETVVVATLLCAVGPRRGGEQVSSSRQFANWVWIRTKRFPSRSDGEARIAAD